MSWECACGISNEVGSTVCDGCGWKREKSEEYKKSDGATPIGKLTILRDKLKIKALELHEQISLMPENTGVQWAEKQKLIETEFMPLYNAVMEANKSIKAYNNEIEEQEDIEREKEANLVFSTAGIMLGSGMFWK